MKKAEIRATKELVSHLLVRQSIQNFLLKKNLDVLKKDIPMIHQIEEVDLDVEHSLIYDHMKDQLSKHGYEEFRYLGQGSQGTVVLASKNNTRYAIKGIKATTGDDQQVQEQKHLIKMEIELLETCNGSPHVLTFFQQFQEENMTYLVLNECKGTLDQLLKVRSHTISEMSVIKYSKDIAEGIYHIHKKNILIQDMKLENILIDCLNNAVVGDLGLGNKIQQNGIAQYEFQGNSLYRAPEGCAFHRQKFIDYNIQTSFLPSQKSDAFSFGYLIYGLIFGESSLCQYLTKKDEPLSFPERMDSFKYKESLKNIILGLTRFNPLERMTIQDAFLLLKGMVSIEFKLEQRFYDILTIDHNQLLEIYKGKIEFIEQSRRRYFSILEDENSFLQKAQEIIREYELRKDKLRKQQDLVEKLLQEIESLKKQIAQLKEEVVNEKQINSKQKQDHEDEVNALKQQIQNLLDQLKKKKDEPKSEKEIPSGLKKEPNSQQMENNSQQIETQQQKEQPTINVQTFQKEIQSFQDQFIKFNNKLGNGKQIIKNDQKKREQDENQNEQMENRQLKEKNSIDVQTFKQEIQSFQDQIIKINNQLNNGNQIIKNEQFKKEDQEFRKQLQSQLYQISDLQKMLTSEQQTTKYLQSETNTQKQKINSQSKEIEQLKRQLEFENLEPNKQLGIRKQIIRVEQSNKQDDTEVYDLRKQLQTQLEQISKLKKELQGEKQNEISMQNQYELQIQQLKNQLAIKDTQISKFNKKADDQQINLNLNSLGHEKKQNPNSQNRSITSSQTQITQMRTSSYRSLKSNSQSSDDSFLPITPLSSKNKKFEWTGPGWYCDECRGNYKFQHGYFQGFSKGLGGLCLNCQKDTTWSFISEK